MRASLDVKDETFDFIKKMANERGVSAYQYIRETLELLVAYEKGRIAGEQANAEGTKNIL